MGLTDTARLAVDLSLKGNFASSLAASQKALGKFDASVTRTQTRAYRAGQQIGTGFINSAKLIATGGAIAAGGLVSVLKVAGDFESQLNVINTIAHKNAAELDGIGKAIRKVATDSGTPLADLTQGYYDLLSAGIKAADATKVLTSANTLAIGGLSTTAEAVDLLTTAVNVYGGGAIGAAKYADIFAKTIERGKITAADLAASFSQVGSIAKSSGISIGELGAAYARLTAGGTDAAEASTQIRSAIVALTKVTPALEELQKQTGRNYLSIAGKKGLVEALEIMRKDAAKAGIPLIDLLGRVEGLNFTLATTGPNFKAYNADLAAMGDASGTAAAQMAERQKGLNFQLAILKARVKEAAIVIGSTVLPRIVPVFERLNKALADPKVISQISVFGDRLAGLFSDANIEAGIDALKGAFQIAKDAAPVIADAARITGSAMKIAIDAFRALPPDIQKLAIAGLAVNKLTGGLVTNIAGGLIEAVVKRLVSAVVNVNGAVVNVVGAGIPGIPGAPTPGGGPGGFLKTGAKLAGGIGIAIIGIEALGELIKATSTPEQLAATEQNVINENRRKHGAGVTPAAGPRSGGLSPEERDLLHDQAQRLQDVKDVDLSILAASHKQINATTIAFRAATAALRNANGVNAIRLALKGVIEQLFVKGKGGSGGAATDLKELKAALVRTSDPALRRELVKVIGRVERKVASRQVVEAQLKKADEIARSSKSNVQKIKELKDVQRAIGNRNDGAVKRVQEKIDAAKKAQVAAQNRTTSKVSGLKLSPKIVIPVTTKSVTIINGRSFVGTVNRQSILVRPGQAAVGS